MINQRRQCPHPPPAPSTSPPTTSRRRAQRRPRPHPGHLLRPGLCAGFVGGAGRLTRLSFRGRPHPVFLEGPDLTNWLVTEVMPDEFRPMQETILKRGQLLPRFGKLTQKSEELLSEIEGHQVIEAFLMNLLPLVWNGLIHQVCKDYYGPDLGLGWAVTDGKGLA